MPPETDPDHVPFASSPVMRWFLLAVLIPTAIGVPFLPIQSTAVAALVIVVAELFLCLIILGLFSPRRFGWCWRVVCGMVFLAFVAYFITSLRQNNWNLGPVSRMTPGASPSKALLGTIAVGLPCLKYALTGRLVAKPDVSMTKLRPHPGPPST